MHCVLRHGYASDYDVSYIGYRLAAVPEPGTLALLGLGGGLLLGRRRRRGLA